LIDPNFLGAKELFWQPLRGSNGLIRYSGITFAPKKFGSIKLPGFRPILPSQDKVSGGDGARFWYKIGRKPGSLIDPNFLGAKELFWQPLRGSNGLIRKKFGSIKLPGFRPILPSQDKVSGGDGARFW
jgi:hypothetical protein